MQGSVGNFFMPKKGLGDRHKSQAQKFYKLYKKNPENNHDHLHWAEQSARQAILYDYTNFENWEVLLQIKLQLKDESGIYTLLEDLLSVLGKDSDFIMQLKEINILPSCTDLFYSILKREPLNADKWWERILSEEYNLEEFIERCKTMDFRDRRSNIIFGRRLERLRKHGFNDIFSLLVPYLLAHRPDNYELWIELGKHHESLEDYKKALMCFDQALEFQPNDKNKSRLSSIISRKFKEDLIQHPSTEEILSFQNRLKKLTSSHKTEIVIDDDVSKEFNELEIKLKELIQNNNYQEGFFMSRSLIAEGREWAKVYFEICKEGLIDG